MVARLLVCFLEFTNCQCFLYSVSLGWGSFYWKYSFVIVRFAPLSANLIRLWGPCLVLLRSLLRYDFAVCLFVLMLVRRCQVVLEKTWGWVLPFQSFVYLPNRTLSSGVCGACSAGGRTSCTVMSWLLLHLSLGINPLGCLSWHASSFSDLFHHHSMNRKFQVSWLVLRRILLMSRALSALCISSTHSCNSRSQAAG